jgi:hypothetical protein
MTAADAFFFDRREAKNKVRDFISDHFGVSQLYLTHPTFFSRLDSRPAATVHDEYWHLVFILGISISAKVFLIAKVPTVKMPNSKLRTLNYRHYQLHYHM